MLLYFLIHLLALGLCNSEDVVRQSHIPADILHKCFLPRDSRICNPDEVMTKEEVEEVEDVLQVDCNAQSDRNYPTMDSIGVYIGKRQEYSKEQGFLIRKAIAEQALQEWYPNCTLGIFFVIWIRGRERVCSGFLQTNSDLSLDEIDLRAICDDEMKKNASIVKTLRAIIMNTRRQISLRNDEDITASLPMWKLIIVLTFSILMILAVYSTYKFLRPKPSVRQDDSKNTSLEVPANELSQLTPNNGAMLAEERGQLIIIPARRL